MGGCWGMRGGREKQKQELFQKEGTICSPGPLWGLVFPFLIARVPLTLIRLFVSPPPSTSDPQTVPLLMAYGICPSCPPPPASGLCRPLPRVATTTSLSPALPGSASGGSDHVPPSAQKPSKAGHCLENQVQVPSSCWPARPFPVWLPPRALPAFCLPTVFSP